jgi:hypothetical protein
MDLTVDVEDDDAAPVNEGELALTRREFIGGPDRNLA